MAGNLLANTLSRASFANALGEEAFVRAMLAFESALARSQADAGVIPAEAAETIEAVCTSAKLPAQKLAGTAGLPGPSRSLL